MKAPALFLRRPTAKVPSVSRPDFQSDRSRDAAAMKKQKTFSFSGHWKFKHYPRDHCRIARDCLPVDRRAGDLGHSHAAHFPIPKLEPAF